MLDERFLNPQIKEFEMARYARYEKAKRDFGEAIDESVYHEALPQFVQWYIQKSINAQVRYAEDLVRAQLREQDKKSLPQDMEEAIKKEEEAKTNIVENYLTEASYKNKAVFSKDAHARRKAAKGLIRSSRYQSSYGE